jgi:glycosyltransferase involved in cell wall biosynthesis
MDTETLLSRSGEGIPQSLMQAMLVGTPVIGTSIGGIPEIIHDGATGRLVPPCSPSKLSIALKETLYEEAKTSSQIKLAQAFIKKNHSPKKMGSSILNIILSS